MNPASASTFDPAILWLITGWVLIALAAILLLFALFKDRSRGRKRCPKCWYDMTGAPTLTCPECGRIARSERTLFKTRRRWRTAILALLLLLLPGLISLRVPRAIEHGWLDAVPLVLLQPALWWERERAEELFEQYGPNLVRPARRVVPSNPNTTKRSASHWERMLIAAEIGRRLEMIAGSNDDDRLARLLSICLGNLNRDARVTLPLLYRLNARGNPHVLIPMRELTISGGHDFTAALLRSAQDPQYHDHAADVLGALTAVYFANGRPSATQIIKLLRPDDEFSADMLLSECIREDYWNQQPSAKQVTLLRAMLTSPHSEIWQRTVARIAEHLATTEECEAELDKLWRGDPDSGQSIVILAAVTKLTNSHAKWGPRVVRSCVDADVGVRQQAIRAIALWIQSGRVTVRDLHEWREALNPSDTDRSVAKTVAWVRELLLTNPDTPAGWALAIARCGLGEEFPTHAAPIVLQHSNSSTRSLFIAEIGSSLGPDHTTEFAAAVLKNEPDEYVRATALDSLIRPFASFPAMQALIAKSLIETSEPVLINACLAAGNMGRADPDITARLVELSRHESSNVSAVAAAALKKLQEPPPPE